MSTNYRIGIWIVVATIGVAACLCLAVMGLSKSVPIRAGQDLGSNGYHVGEFELVRALRPGREIRGSGGSSLDCVVYLHTLSAVVPTRHGRDEGARTTPATDACFARERDSRSRPRYAGCARSICPKNGSFAGPLVVSDWRSIRHPDSCANTIQASSGGNLLRRAGRGPKAISHSDRLASWIVVGSLDPSIRPTRPPLMKW